MESINEENCLVVGLNIVVNRPPQCYTTDDEKRDKQRQAYSARTMPAKYIMNSTKCTNNT